VCRSINMSDIKIKMLSSSFIWKNVFHSLIIAFVFSATVNSQDYGYAIQGEKFLGSFNKLTYHPVHGDLFMKDAKTLIIRNFVYDGEGPDAFFVVGKRPMRRNRIVIRDRRDAVPLPYEDSYSAYSRQNTNQRRLRYDDPDIPVLGRYEGQDIELTLPQGIEVDNIKWISLYCRQFNMDFGHVKIDNNPWGRPRTT